MIFCSRWAADSGDDADDPPDWAASGHEICCPQTADASQRGCPKATDRLIAP
jgi:hypothetical protein